MHYARFLIEMLLRLVIHAQKKCPVLFHLTIKIIEYPYRKHQYIYIYTFIYDTLPECSIGRAIY